MDRRVQSEQRKVGNGPYQPSVRFGVLGLQKLAALLLPNGLQCVRTAGVTTQVWAQHPQLYQPLGALVPGSSP